MANLKRWRVWFQKQPFSFKWFLWIVLLRPIIDLFWWVKETSAFSPLQVAGLVTFSLALIYSFRLPSRKKQQFPLVFLLFGFIFVLNLLLITLEQGSMGAFIRFLRFLSPLFLFVYLVKVVNTKARLEGLLFTFLVSSIVPLAMLYYEAFFDPITEVAISDKRGGGFRLTGLYADLFNYMSYVIGDLLILAYFFIRSLKDGRKSKVKIWHIAMVLLFALIGVNGLKHQASWVVMFFIIASTVLFSYKNQRVKRYVVLVGFPLLMLAPIVVFPRLEALFAKELKAYTGEADSKKIMNGRLVRWEYYFEEWSESSVASQLFGISFSNLSIKNKAVMSSGGMHSDYIRFLFTTGIVGLAAFLLFYLRVYLGRVNFHPPEKFLITTSLGIMCLYSISSNPFGASGSLMFVLFPGLGLSLNSAYRFYTSGLATKKTHAPELNQLAPV